MSSVIINNLPGIEGLSYLELGVGDGVNFGSIKSVDKQSVDTNGLGLWTGTTDDWFSGPGKDAVWDIIFIDANHDYPYVVRDFNNSVVRCRKWLLLHDMVPPHAGYAHPSFCSDSYKVLWHILRNEQFTTYTMDTNYGFTLVRMPAAPINPAPEVSNVGYGEFMEYMAGVKRWSDAEIIEILRSSP